MHSFVELTEYLLSQPGVSFFLSNNISQDPLENFFGQQRQRGRVNENPNALEFMRNTQALRVINTACATIKGNCRRQSAFVLAEKENEPLPKRRSNHPHAKLILIIALFVIVGITKQVLH